MSGRCEASKHALHCDDDGGAQGASEAKPGRSRRTCERCGRPESVCLCSTLPQQPLPLAGRLIVLQHPHEQKKKLATVPVLQKSVAGVEVLRGRRYCEHLEAHASLREAVQGAAAGRFPLFVLFPGPGSRDLREAAAELHANSSSHGLGSAQQPCSCAAVAAAQQPQPLRGDGVQSVGQRCEAGQRSCGDPLYTLLVLDGTWPQAKEMYNAVMPVVLLPTGPGICVQLPPEQLRPTAPEQRPAGCEPAAGEPGGMHAASGGQRAAEQGAPPQDSPLLLRVEPEPGCMSTCEAAARALALLEPRGAAVHAAIMRPLARLVEIQARWDPALAQRLQGNGGYRKAQ